MNSQAKALLGSPRACVDAILHRPAGDADGKSTLRRFGLRDAQPASREAVTGHERMGSS
jgi:hypothetical protein